MSDFKAYLVVMIVTMTAVILSQAYVDAEKSAAKTECYKAAQVNQNIKCEAEND